MNTPAKAGLALAAIAALWAGGTAYSGNRVKSEMLAQVEGLKTDAMFPMRVTSVDYQKSFMGATRTMQIEFGCEPQPGSEAKPAKLTWRDHIQHGPLPGFKGFGAARIESEIVLDEKDRAAMQKATGLDHLPLHITTLAGFGGGTDSTVKIETLHLTPDENSELHLEGIQARIVKAKDGSVRYEGQIPVYKVSGKREGFQMVMEGMTFEGEGLAPHWWLTTGKSKGSMKTMAFQGRGPDGQPKTMFALNDLVYSQSGSLDAKQLYSAEGSFSGKGEAVGQKIDAFSMKASVKRLNMAAYAEFMKNSFANACKTQNAADAKARMDEAMAPLKRLLPADPSFSLDELKVTFAGHTASMNYAVGVKGVTEEDLKSPMLAMLVVPKLEASMGAKLPIAFIKEVMKAAGKEMPPEAMDAQIQMGIQQGFVKREGDILSAEVSFKNSAATLNGKPIPLPGLPVVPPPQVADPAASQP